MITANMRNRPFISEHMKISGIQTLEEAKEFVERLTDTLAKQEMLSLGEQVRNFKNVIFTEISKFRRKEFKYRIQKKRYN